ncbi:hypothetical protein DAPPUDRAFT_118884 [Daphnia pulex]|uniref:Uncharacterized protein n=1 Tax=Daphnia pulex TaxID=6669 RepID=E9HWY3_DAPPU|nr:hypothetical protein DAPPUDRAFT_118884 [Daphnia pulex]|eukprot:EFX63747.1 hypothetical protein DAPPUDRAFT_118884 [Daphnia pulex]
MSQSGSSNDITVAIARCSTLFHSTSTSSWTVSPLIPRPSTKQDNTPTVFPLALGVIRVQWKFETSTVHQQQASGTTRARSTAVTYPSPHRARVTLALTASLLSVFRFATRDAPRPAQRYGHCRLVHYYTARVIPQIVTEHVLDLYTWTVESQMASLRKAAFNNSIGVYLVEDEMEKAPSI